MNYPWQTPLSFSDSLDSCMPCCVAAAACTSLQCRSNTWVVPEGYYDTRLTPVSTPGGLQYKRFDRVALSGSFNMIVYEFGSCSTVTDTYGPWVEVGGYCEISTATQTGWKQRFDDPGPVSACSFVPDGISEGAMFDYTTVAGTSSITMTGTNSCAFWRNVQGAITISYSGEIEGWMEYGEWASGCIRGIDVIQEYRINHPGLEPLTTYTATVEYWEVVDYVASVFATADITVTTDGDGLFLSDPVDWPTGADYLTFDCVFTVAPSP